MFGFVKILALFIYLMSKPTDAKNEVENQEYDKIWNTLFGFDLNELFSSGLVSTDLQNFPARIRDYERGNEKEFNVGFGGPSHASEKRMLFCNASTYVNKVINHAQLQLERNTRIWANNPSQVIDKIPHTPIIFTLKYIEGASSLGTNGTSWAIHYFDEVYVSTRCKFDEIRYNYDVQIKPYNLFSIPKSLTIVLGDAPAAISFSMEKNKSTVPRFEYVNPTVGVDFGTHRWFNYVLNYVIDEKFPKIKRKLVKIVSKDTLILLNDRLKNAQ